MQHSSLFYIALIRIIDVEKYTFAKKTLLFMNIGLYRELIAFLDYE